MRLVVGRPNIPDEFRLLYQVTEILKTRRLTNNGPLVQELERRIAERLEVKHCIAVANGTLGLQIAAKALGLTGEVIMPSWTFVATAHAMKWIGLEPVFADVDGHTLSPIEVEKAITERTSAILPVHTFGIPSVSAGMDYIAEKYNLKLFYDAAHALGCLYNGRPIGNFGDCEVFSFHATKFFNTFEGGAITTNDDDLAERCRRMRNFGFVDYDTVADVGINAKMSEIHAAMGLCILDSLGNIANAYRENYFQYKSQLDDLMFSGGNLQYIVIEPPNRDDIADELAAKGIMARRYFYPGVHQMPPYNEKKWDLPNTERLAKRTLCLPTGPTVTETDIDEICEVVLKWS